MIGSIIEAEDLKVLKEEFDEEDVDELRLLDDVIAEIENDGAVYRVVGGKIRRSQYRRTEIN